MNKRRKITINNSDRENHVNNDYSLYTMKAESGLNMRKFVKQNKEMIDEVILEGLGQGKR